MLFDLGNGVTMEAVEGSERARILLGMGKHPVGEDGDELTVADLREEIDRLNEGRDDDDQLSKGGSKAGLADRIAQGLAGPSAGEAPPSR